MTMTSVQPSGRFGALNITEDNQITSFKEKPKGDGAWINGGFLFVSLKFLILLKQIIQKKFLKDVH